MYSCAKYTSAYRNPEHHGTGYADVSRYLRINSAGVYEAPPVPVGVKRDAGRRDFYFAYNLTGITQMLIDGEQLESGGGSAFFYCPDEPQCYWYEQPPELKCYWIHFTGSCAEELLRASGLMDQRVSVLGRAPEICDRIEAIIDEINTPRPGNEQVAAAQLAQLLAQCGRLLKEKRSPDHSGRKTAILASTEFLRQHYSQSISIKQLAGDAGMSLNHFSLSFKQLVGKSPQQYLTDYRLQQAIKLICYCDMSIAEIAREIGYDDPMYFSRVFKKHIRVSPTEFLRQQAITK